jgi:biopolymer transport protein ExbD
MAMSPARMGENEPIIEMNTTPLIDVLLVLLIMFIITLPLMTHSTTLQMPGAGKQTASIPEVVRVVIDFDGLVLWNGQPVDMAQLESYLASEAKKPEQPDVQISPDRRAKYDTVARVLAIAQRTGMKRIGVDTN